jgi:hypothetical protein
LRGIRNGAEASGSLREYVKAGVDFWDMAC